MPAHTKQTYIVITGDIVASRKQTASQYMAKVPNILTHINKKYHPVVNFKLSAGDEIQGVILPESKPFEMLISLLGALLPLQMKCGIGVGTISTTILDDPGLMRGDAFEYARDALEQIGNSKTIVRMAGDIQKVDWINTILILLSPLLQSWDERVFRRYLLYIEHGNVEKVATLESVSGEAINKHLNAYAVRQIISAVTFLDQSIDK